MGEDGHTGKLFIVQARPETVCTGQVISVIRWIHRVRLSPKAVLSVIAWRGSVKVIHDISEMNRIEPGDAPVTDMTDPDWNRS
ncbi:hypothetical protein ACNKHL_09020 [Shigella flexneri]